MPIEAFSPYLLSPRPMSIYHRDCHLHAEVKSHNTHWRWSRFDIAGSVLHLSIQHQGQDVFRGTWPCEGPAGLGQFERLCLDRWHQSLTLKAIQRGELLRAWLACMFVQHLAPGTHPIVIERHAGLVHIHRIRVRHFERFLQASTFLEPHPHKRCPNMLSLQTPQIVIPNSQHQRMKMFQNKRALTIKMIRARRDFLQTPPPYSAQLF